LLKDKTMPKWWTFFEDNAGGFSMMRLAFLLTVLAVLANWSYVVFLKGELIDFPQGAVALLVGFGGVKTVQRFGEKPSPE
jgi:hypothetical protein